ncbi:MAG: hypothetical protein IPK17_03185 [Chloroflexi bacterium]|uniref:hypothetical protein n=1 Tax=Candidatus Flexifilum breve TaxID=3140694 RepID=UPI003134B4DF|nr:hypothetical protein [Chloroflexota bacterium]
MNSAYGTQCETVRDGRCGKAAAEIERRVERRIRSVWRKAVRRQQIAPDRIVHEDKFGTEFRFSGKSGAFGGLFDRPRQHVSAARAPPLVRVHE